MKITTELLKKYPDLDLKEIIEKEETARYKSKLPPKDRKNRGERLDEQTIKKNEDK